MLNKGPLSFFFPLNLLVYRHAKMISLSYNFHVIIERMRRDEVKYRHNFAQNNWPAHAIMSIS